MLINLFLFHTLHIW
uniref:Uncharacterized protein n=1 Tax=Anguilla anguilla TaxID=7936 RepID=A0A0E9T0R8_ANGAN